MPCPIPQHSLLTHYASSLDYPTDSEDAMYYASDEKPSPTLTSYNSILRSSPEYLMNEAASFAVTRSQTSQNPSNKRKDPPQSSPSTSPTDSADSYWEDSVLSPSPSEQARNTWKQAGGTALMMTVSYTAKKKQKLATGLRIPGSESRAKRPKEG